MHPWTWISHLVFSERSLIWAKQSRPVNQGSLQWEGWPGELLQNCSGPPTHMDAARGIVAGGLGIPAFLCISGTNGCWVAGGKPRHLGLPHLLQVGLCELSRWNLLFITAEFFLAAGVLVNIACVLWWEMGTLHCIHLPHRCLCCFRNKTHSSFIK